MRKMTTVLAGILILSTVLAGCGGSEKTSSNVGSSEGKVVLKIHYPTPDLKEKRAQEDDKIKRFQEKHPNVEIVKDDWQYSVNEVGIKMAANEAPTFFNTFATEAKFLVQKGWVADITSMYNTWQFKDQMNPVLQDQFVIDGKVYGLAEKGYVTTTIVNKKLLDAKGVAQPPYDWTWDDMLATVKGAANPAQGISGIAPMGRGNEAGWNWTNFLYEAGGDIQKVADGKVTATFHSDAGLKALEFYKKLRWEANAIPQDWALGWGDAISAFQQGRTAMVMAGSDGAIEPALNQGGLKPNEILTYPMPAAQKGGKHIGVLGGDYLVINPNATKAEQQAAFDYITFDYFSNNGLTALEANVKERKDDGKYFVPPLLEYFSADSEFGRKVKAVYDKYDNVYQYDPAIKDLLDGKPEAQYNTQDYYGTMSNVIQKLFSDQGTDLKLELNNAAKLVQTKYFDSISAK